MNANQIINMILNRLMRKGINRGINAALGGGGKRAMTGADKQPAKQARQAKQKMKAARRLM